MTSSLLGQYHKTLTEEQNEVINNCKVLNNPLLRKRFIELLISCENHETLSTTIRQIASAQTVKEFVLQYFKRISLYFSTTFTNVLSYLALSRDGLQGFEIMELLTHLDNKEKVEPQRVNALLRILEEFLVVQGSSDVTSIPCYINFKNPVIKQALAELINDPEKYRKDIVGLLSSNNSAIQLFLPTSIKFAEILFQLYSLHDYPNLYQKILETETVRTMSNGRDFAKYWTTLYNLKDFIQVSMADYYSSSNIDDLSIDDFILVSNKLLTMSKNIGNYSDSISVIKSIVNELHRRNLVTFGSSEASINYISIRLIILIINIFELGNLMGYITLEIYNLYIALINEIRGKLQKTCPGFLFHVQILYAESLLILEEKNISAENVEMVYTSLKDIEIQIIIHHLIDYGQQKFILLSLYRRLLMLGYFSGPFYDTIIKGTLSEDIIETTVEGAIAYGDNETKREVGLVYLYAYLSGVAAYNECHFLEKAIMVFTEIEDDGAFNENCNLIYCYALQYKYYMGKGNIQKSNECLKIIYERVSRNKWDITPKLQRNLSELGVQISI